MIKLLYIETFGCQMNERDSEIMAQLLAEHSYLLTDQPEQADLVVVNTCSIRGKAAHKAYSCFGRYKKLKEKNPHLILAVSGCVAQQDGAALLERMPYIDIVLGPQSIYALPSLLAKARCEKKPQIATDLSANFVIPPFLPNLADSPARKAELSSLPDFIPFRVQTKLMPSEYKRFITIMQGCDNFCTYCVVPYTRGREISRSFTDILAEATHLVAQGVKEITLIGQNVNSYGQKGDHKQNQGFPALLRAVAAIDGLQRLRFTTSHPKDLSEELMRCFVEIPSLCPHFHLPLQSGSNSILQRMNRKYTIETYLDKVARLREYLPHIALTTDIIVGFPGETDDDFAATMQALETVGYHGSYSFKYSDRPNAKAADFPDKVAEEIKTERLARLQARQEAIALERKQTEIGKSVEVMVEGASKASGLQWSGRTGANQIVNFACDTRLLSGQLLMVEIVDACQNSLRGKLR